MRNRSSPAEAILALNRLADAADRRTSFRQAVTALGQSVRVSGPPPLDGVDPESLRAAVAIALQTGLCDDLDFIAPGAAALALYELTLGLPVGSERRDLGRRVFASIYEGQASTFATVASRMALGSAKALETVTMRARISLVLDMPVGTSVDAGALAYCLVARRELTERWVIRPSSGPLTARRQAAKLVEHAAREAVYRTQQGDMLPKDLLASELVRPARRALLADREPLVWRHAAIARGLLASVDSHLLDQIHEKLDLKLTPTEWRRAAVSLVACLVGDPSGAMRILGSVLQGEVPKRDPGILATMIWGLGPVVEAEPDAAEELLDRLAATRRPDVAEALAELLADMVHPSFGERAAGMLRGVLASKLDTESPALRGLTRRALEILDRDDTETLLSDRVRTAVHAYETSGARAAFDLAQRALSVASGTALTALSFDPHDESTLTELVESLADLDNAVLERSRLFDLMLLGRSPGDAEGTVADLEVLRNRLGDYLLDAEQTAVTAPWSRSGSVATSRRLRALLHLVDTETIASDGERERERVSARLVRCMQVLFTRLAAGPDASVHRILCATLARTLDAAVREAVAEPADILLLTADHLTDRQSVAMIAEASTHVDVQSVTETYASFLSPVRQQRSPESEGTDSVTFSTSRREDDVNVARRVFRLARVSAGGTHRAEALRQALLRLARGLEAIAAARGMEELVTDAASGAAPVDEVEASADALRELLSATRRRVLRHDAGANITIVTDVAQLSSLVERAVSGGVPPNERQVSMATQELVAELPVPIAEAARHVLMRLVSLPIAAPPDLEVIPLERRRDALPDWLLPRRTIGAFFVVRALGAGGGSSVFLARRLEDRHDEEAETFALKVPQYDPTTARSLSEQQFMQLFREEATALLGLPAHPNLARFVTFDLAARPKPILVMELIKGVPLDRLVRSRSLNTARVLAYLDGILAGLAALHQAGVGHLDVKPSNVILREGTIPVLVDFGLSGRQLRPGCGTVEYCAPEVLGVVPEGHVPTPPPADVYSFGAVAFEMLTATALFEGDDELALASAHVSHDGWPPALARFAAHPAQAELGVLLAACLRRDPRMRATVGSLRDALARLGPRLERLTWPLDASAVVSDAHP